MGRHVLGRDRLLRLFLGGSWLFHRLALEIAGELRGDPFYRSASGLTEDLFWEWVRPGSRVLDLGCGNGRWVRAAAPHAAWVVGIDHDPAAIEQARSRTAAPNALFRVADVTRGLALRLSGERFDVALLVHVLEHLDDPVSLLLELRSVAAGVVVEVPDFEADPLNALRRELGLPCYADADHVREYTSSFLVTQLEAAGWTPARLHHRSGSVVAFAHPSRNRPERSAFGEERRDPRT